MITQSRRNVTLRDLVLQNSEKHLKISMYVLLQIYDE